jgi:sulfane dehydrogenase subunit SoxC
MDTETDQGITLQELQLAARNHGMPLEGLRYDVTPLGMHYLLTHFDIPAADGSEWTIHLGGRVRDSLMLTVAELRSRPAVTLTVTMECAGNGRARLLPRPLSQPWLNEAVGTAEWTGTPLAPILQEAGLLDDAVEIKFVGADHGTQGGVEQDYERSLSIAEALGPDVLLAYAINGQPLPPQHGYPVRLLVPGWYGMTSVKWLRQITAISKPFNGFQMDAYRLRQDPDEEGVPVTRIQPRALMIPPGFPDFFERTRTVEAGPVHLEGRAWSGFAPIALVEVSVDGAETWSRARLDPPMSPHAWRRWSLDWHAAIGDHELVVRAADEAGNIQPVDPAWNHHGLTNNAAQRVTVTVR